LIVVNARQARCRNTSFMFDGTYMMVRSLISIAACCMVLAASPQAKAQLDGTPPECLDPAQVSTAAKAFDAFCARCHKPDKIAGKWFSRRDTGEAAIAGLASFLDGHGNCPHHSHDLLARWLAEKHSSP
jgi:hypothetical protein